MKIKWLYPVSIVIFSFYMGERVISQVIESDPEFPTVNDSATITFHVNRCDCNLIGYSGDIYAHTGVLTDESTDEGDWKHVVADWQENIEKARLEKVDDSTLVLHITPDIYSYYGLSASTKVEQLAFVFRSADRSLQTINYYYHVYEPGLSISIDAPEMEIIAASGDVISIAAQGIALGTDLPDSLTLYIDDVKEYVAYASELNYELTVSDPGQHWIKVVADNGTFSAADSIFYFVRDAINVLDLPAGISDGVTIIDDNTVTIVIYAPNKESILLIGDFNDWSLDNDYLMSQTPDGNRFWLSIPGLTAGEEYAFQYLIDGNIRIADPYTEKILDPWNDPYIPSSTYPDLKSYPAGKTTGIVSVFQTVQDEYAWQTDTFTPDKLTDLVIYEIHVQNFTDEGTFSALIDTLGYLEQLGINAIELMPVNEFEGNLSWGYNPSFYFALDKNYGTKNDFKALVDACHAHGIAVIIDMVLNHSYGQSPLVRMYWDEAGNKPAADNPWYNQNHNFVDNTSAQWGYDFNHESQATQDLVDSINSYWMSEYKIDGFRFDFTKGFSNTPWTGTDNWASSYDASRIAILTRMSDEIWQRNEDAFVIFEHLADNSEETELADHGIMLWGNMNYQYNEATMGYTSNLDWGFYSSRGWSGPQLVTYMESHDEERLMYKNLRWGNSSDNYDVTRFPNAISRIEAAAAFFLTIPGPKMIFEWGELGYDYSINRCTDGTVDDTGGCRLSLKPVGWDLYENDYRYRLYKVFQALIKLRKEEEVFETTNIQFSTNTTMKQIILSDAGMSAVILGNFGITENSVTVTFPAAGTWYNYFTGEAVSIESTEESFSLMPGEYRIYFDQQLEVPDIPIVINEVKQENSLLLKVYPNPTHGSIRIETAGITDFVFELYTLTGERIIQKNIRGASTGYSLDLEQETGLLNNGTYLYRITGNEVRQQELLIILN